MEWTGMERRVRGPWHRSQGKLSIKAKLKELQDLQISQSDVHSDEAGMASMVPL